MTLTLNAFADCKNAYEIKAEKRAKSNSIIKTTAVYVGAASAFAANGIALAGPGGAAFGAVGGLAVGGIFGTVGFSDDPLLFKPTDKNTFYKVLRAIEAAERNVVSSEVAEALDKKISLNSLSDFQQTEVKQQVIKLINEMNKDQTLCLNEDKKVKLKNFNKLINILAEKI